MQNLETIFKVAILAAMFDFSVLYPVLGRDLSCLSNPPHREETQSAFDTGKKELVIACDDMRGVAIYDGGSIKLSVSTIAGQPIFGKTSPDAFAIYKPLVLKIVTDNIEVSSWNLSIRGYAVYGPRLAAAAANDKSWDAIKGRPRVGSVNDYVVDIGNRARVFEEVDRLAGDVGFKARLLAVENVELCPLPRNPNLRAPCGGLMWFQMQR